MREARVSLTGLEFQEESGLTSIADDTAYRSYIVVNLLQELSYGLLVHDVALVCLESVDEPRLRKPQDPVES
jgi:hypothetical protein